MSGPPTATVYMATTMLVHDSDPGAHPGHPTSTEHLSILLQQAAQLENGHHRWLVGFLVPELARPWLKPGAELPVLEGPHTIGIARLVTVFETDDS